MRGEAEEHGKQKDQAEGRGERQRESDEQAAGEQRDAEERKVVAEARDHRENAAGEEGKRFVVGEVGQFV